MNDLTSLADHLGAATNALKELAVAHTRARSSHPPAKAYANLMRVHASARGLDRSTVTHLFPSTGAVLDLVITALADIEVEMRREGAR